MRRASRHARALINGFFEARKENKKEKETKKKGLV